NIHYDQRGAEKPWSRARCPLFDSNSPGERPDTNAICRKSAPYAYLINAILEWGPNRVIGFGANSVLNISHKAAVKTGTTNDFRDNWTIGYTPDLLVGV